MTQTRWDKIVQNVNFNLEIDIAELKKLTNPDTPILEYGCGYGRNCAHLQASGFQTVIGCDSSLEMIKRGKLEYPELTLFQSKDIKIAYPDGYFGGILFCALLTCIPESDLKEKIILEAKRLLRTDGVIHIVEFCSSSGKVFESGLGVKMHYQKPDEIRELLGVFYSEIKFEVTAVQTMSGKTAQAINYFGKREV